MINISATKKEDKFIFIDNLDELKNLLNTNLFSQEIARKKIYIDCQITNHVMYLTNISSKIFVSDAELFFKAQASAASFYQLEKVCLLYDVYNIEAEILGQKLIYKDNLLPSVDMSSPMLKDINDIKEMRKPDFLKKGRSKFVLDLLKLYRKITRKDPKIRFCAPFSLAANIFGYQNLIYFLMIDKKSSNYLFDFLVYEVLIPWIEIQREILGKSKIIASGVDAWGTIPNINLDIMRDYIIPSCKKINNYLPDTYISGLGGECYLNNLEDVYEYLDLKRYINPYVIKAFEDDIDKYGINIYLDYAAKYNMDLLVGINADTILNKELSYIEEKIEGFANSYFKSNGIKEEKNKLILYLNDIPPSISIRKLKKIIGFIKNCNNLFKGEAK